MGSKPSSSQLEEKIVILLSEATVKLKLRTSLSLVIELRSKSARLKPLQDKMQEYLASGLRLGWLINPQQRQVEIYRQNKSVEILTMPTLVSGEDVLPGLEVNLDY